MKIVVSCKKFSKIVILTQYFLPEMGAPQSRLYETANGLIKLGWDVRIITAMPNYPTGQIFLEYKGKMFREDLMDSIPVYRYTLYASNAKKRLPRIISMISFSITSLFSVLKLKRFKPDYIFTETPPLTLAVSGLILSKLTGARHIMNVSDIWPLSAFELGAVSNGYFYNAVKKCELFLYRNSFACTGQSQQIVTYLENNGSRKAHLYRNGVDIGRFHVSRSDVKDQRMKFIYAGLLGFAQGVLALCKNIDFAELGVEFHIYGDGLEKNEIRNFLGTNKNRGIYLHAPVKRQDMPETLMNYDVTIIPLIKPIYGAVPSKIYESMAAGLPILFAGGGEGAELIKEYGTGWVCTPSNYNEIKAKIGEIAKMSKASLQEIKTKGLDAAKNVFNREIQIDKLNQFLSA